MITHITEFDIQIFTDVNVKFTFEGTDSKVLQDLLLRLSKYTVTKEGGTLLALIPVYKQLSESVQAKFSYNLIGDWYKPSTWILKGLVKMYLFAYKHLPQEKYFESTGVTKNND